MTMKKLTAFLLLTTIFGCTRVKDISYPKDKDGLSVSYVKVKSKGTFFDVHRIADDDAPVWCSLNKDSATYVTVLSRYLSPEKEQKQMYVACYSGKKPVLDEAPVPDGSALKVKDNMFFRYSPVDQFYVVGARLSTTCKQAMMVYYFTLYSELCSAEDIECCMNGSGEDVNVYALVRTGMNDAAKTKIKDFFHYLENPQMARSTLGNSYELFKSHIQDKCSWNRWFHGAVSMGLEKPQDLLKEKEWALKFDSLRSCKMSIKKKAVIFAGQAVPETLDEILP